MKISLTLVSLFAALAVQAAPGDYLTKSATGTTTANVYLPAGPAFRLISYDVTADNATNRLYYYVGTTRLTLAAAVPTTGSTSTNITFINPTLSSNETVLFQNPTGAVAHSLAGTNYSTTNKSIALLRPLGTNLAVGDTFKERLPLAYRPVAAAASDATTLYLSATTGLDTNDVILLDRGSGQALTTATVDTLIPTTNKLVRLTTALPQAVAAAVTVYRQQTNNPHKFTVNIAASETAVYLLTTNGMMTGTNLFIQKADGSLGQLVDTDAVSGTNVTLSAGLNFAVTTNDLVYVLGPTTTTKLPALAFADSLILDGTNGFTSGSTIVVGNTVPFRTGLASNASDTNVFTMTVAAQFGAAAATTHSIYKLTNTFTVKFAAAETDSTVIADVSTGLASGDTVIISPATGGMFENQVFTPIANYITKTYQFNAAPGIILAAGDSAWVQSSGVNTLVGNATLRREAEALYSVGANLPLRILITGATACSINSAVVKYDY